MVAIKNYSLLAGTAEPIIYTSFIRDFYDILWLRINIFEIASIFLNKSNKFIMSVENFYLRKRL